MSYNISTVCVGNRYEPILPKWKERIKNKCKNSEIYIYNQPNINFKFGFREAWWDVVRLFNNLNILKSSNIPITQIDIDLIIEKDIQDIINLPYDLIISKEIGGNEAYPKECSSILGFGICSGFYVLKPSSLTFMEKIFNLMYNLHYNSYSDQVTIMNYIVNNNYNIRDEEIVLDGIKYTNKIIEVDDIKICVLDFNIIIRDPILNINQYGNHINIGNVGGTNEFLKYFDDDLENLPLTCRCGKTQFGDYNICKHIDLRKKK